ncbi:MAG TPA: VWA domain-containing protein [Methylomirabilota bacterium]|jgi:VWFA-related protein|nr:VWA domain-containing protein [Methylomirabilota bacterium]
MRVRAVLLSFVLLAILLFTSSTVPQSPQSSNQPPVPQDSPVIRTTTHLVQVSVVVTDKKGQPITGLKKENFTVMDESNPQQIAFFSAEAPRPTMPTTPLPKNVYTNRYDLQGQDPGAVTAVLFDSLNTSPPDQEYVRQQVVKFLKTLKPQDHVAIYALTTKLLLLHEFTQDSSALVNAANQFKPKELAAYDASNRQSLEVPALAGDGAWTQFQNALNETDARIADRNKANRAETTAEAFTAIANHLATIPGRKNLIWVSGSFPSQIIVNSIGGLDRQSQSLDTNNTPSSHTASSTQTARRGGQDRSSESLTSNTTQVARALNRVDMVLYPVDATGIAPNSMMDPKNPYSDSAVKCMDCVNQVPEISSGMFDRQDLRDTERSMADATGGEAFYGSNDIKAAMSRAFDDGRYAYTIGFYPNHGEWNGKFRKLKIHTSIDGAKLRYRAGYYAAAERADSGEARAKAAMRTAAFSPLEAAGLGLIVSGKLAGPVAERKIELHVSLDPKQLLLLAADNHRKGGVDLYFVQRDAAGETVAAENQRVGLNFEEKQYEYLSTAGIVLAKHLTITAQSADVRVFARDTSSEALGSVTIPVQALFEGPQTASSLPAKMESPK